MRPSDTSGNASASADHQFWQSFAAAGTYPIDPPSGHRLFYPADLADGRQLALPIRDRGGGEALASLIINQASFEVLDVLASELAKLAQAFAPELVVGIPTLGLTLAQETARRLGHSRYVALGTSKKFWYDEALSVPLRSITSPERQKRLYVDPRMLPLLADRSILLVDDVLSSGASITAACRLLAQCGTRPTVIGCAMLQTERWREAVAAVDPALVQRVVGVLTSPRLVASPCGGWRVPDPAR